jgi:outer membrane lipoprotein-sorting protein
MKNFFIFCSIILSLALTSQGYADDQDVMAIINKMKIVNESALEMAQKMEILIKTNDKVDSKLLAGKAQKLISGGKNAIIVLLEPDSIKGFAYMYREKDDMTVDRWIYFPAINRVRRIVEPWNAYDSFLNTDFNYADIGFVDTKGEYTLLGEENIENAPAYKVEKRPKSSIQYYSRIVTWISKKTYLPLRQDFYDTANRLYKRQLLEDIIMVGKTPVPYKITMLNLQTNTSTVLSVKELRTGLDLDLPDEIFMPDRLSYTASCPIWERVCYPSEIKK